MHSFTRGEEVLGVEEQRRKQERLIRAVQSHLIEAAAVDDSYLQRCTRFLSVQGYEAVIEERGISNRCGYPRCPNILKSADKDTEKQRKTKERFDIHTGKIVGIYDDDSGDYCSRLCLSRSYVFKAALPTSPPYIENINAYENFPAPCATLVVVNSSGNSSSDNGNRLAGLAIVERSATADASPVFKGEAAAVENFIVSKKSGKKDRAIVACFPTAATAATTAKPVGCLPSDEISPPDNNGSEGQTPNAKRPTDANKRNGGDDDPLYLHDGYDNDNNKSSSSRGREEEEEDEAIANSFYFDRSSIASFIICTLLHAVSDRTTALLNASSINHNLDNGDDDDDDFAAEKKARLADLLCRVCEDIVAPALPVDGKQITALIKQVVSTFHLHRSLPPIPDSFAVGFAAVVLMALAESTRPEVAVVKDAISSPLFDQLLLRVGLKRDAAAHMAMIMHGKQ